MLFVLQRVSFLLRMPFLDKTMTKYSWNGIGKGKYKVAFQVWVG